LFLFLLERPLQNSLRCVVSNRIGMKFGRSVLQVNTHRLTESDFRFDVTFSSGSHYVISHNKVLPPGEWKQSVCRRLYEAASVSSWSV